jgi:hypothetical protein
LGVTCRSPYERGCPQAVTSGSAAAPLRSSALRASGAGRLATDRSARLAQCAVAGCRQGGGADHPVRGRELSTVRRHGRCRAVVMGSEHSTPGERSSGHGTARTDLTTTPMTRKEPPPGACNPALATQLSHPDPAANRKHDQRQAVAQGHACRPDEKPRPVRLLPPSTSSNSWDHTQGCPHVTERYSACVAE